MTLFHSLTDLEAQGVVGGGTTYRGDFIFGDTTLVYKWTISDSFIVNGSLTAKVSNDQRDAFRNSLADELNVSPGDLNITYQLTKSGNFSIKFHVKTDGNWTGPKV